MLSHVDEHINKCLLVWGESGDELLVVGKAGLVDGDVVWGGEGVVLDSGEVRAGGEERLVDVLLASAGHVLAHNHGIASTHPFLRLPPQPANLLADGVVLGVAMHPTRPQIHLHAVDLLADDPAAEPVTGL